ncbi:MAG: ferritin-like domain-containing protein [Acidobacteriota bacterium]
MLALTAVFLGLRSIAGDRAHRSLIVALPVSTGMLMAAKGALLTVLATMGFHRGRQLRRGGKVQLPPIVDGDDWARLAMELSTDRADREALGAQWRANGQTEHASVAAFGQLTLQLLHLGAPPSLLAAAQRDALDEIRHAELCFSLARALDGKHESPGPFPAALRLSAPGGSRRDALTRLAVTSLVDGALHEGLSARVIAELAKRAEAQSIQGVLLELARDEGRHAAHGWDVVDWCLAEGGAPVAAALRGAVRALPKTMQSDRPEPAASGSWEPYGIHGHALEAELYASARADVVQRVARITSQSPI